MPILTRDDIEATTSILADIELVDREIEATIRRIRELKKNRQSLTESLAEELEELHMQDEGEESSSLPPCQNKIDLQVPEEQAHREQRSTEVVCHTLAEEAVLSSKKEEASSRTSLLTLRSNGDMEGDGLVQNQVHSRVA